MKRKIFAYLFFALVVLVGILYTWDFNKTRTSHGFFDIILSFLYFISFASFLIVSVFLRPKLKFILLLVSTIIFFITLNILLKKDVLRSKTVLRVKVNHVSDSIPEGKYSSDLNITIDFRKNNRCVVTEAHVDFSYTYPFDYRISNDTINVLGDIVAESNSVLTTKYFIDRKNKLLRPITGSKKKIPCLNITYDNLGR